MKKLIVLCLALLALALAAVPALAEDILVAETDRLALYLTADHCGINVLDKETGVTWSSSMNDPSFTGKIAGLNQKKASSLVTVNITNLVKGAGSITNAVLLNDKKLSTGYELIDNGVRVHYTLGSYRISLYVEIVLEGDTVLITVPFEGIRNYYELEIPKNMALATPAGEKLVLSYGTVCRVYTELNDAGNPVEMTGDPYEGLVQVTYDEQKFTMDAALINRTAGKIVTVAGDYAAVNGLVDAVLEGETLQLPAALINSLAGDADVFSIVSVDMMPFLCSGSDNAEGFLFYPDGSGAILEFQDQAHYKEVTQYFSVYGSLEKQNVILDFFDQEDPTVMMPVYGISIGGNAMLAVIEQGAESARIVVNSSTKILAINNVYASFQYRRGFDDLRVTSRSIKTYDKRAMPTDYALRLMFLPAGQCTYSDMAVAYRTYLLEEQGFERRTSGQSVAIDLFMTAPEEGLLFDVQRTVTTLEEAAAIMDAMAERGVTDVVYALKGWSRGGYGSTPNRFPVEGAVGSNRELTALTEKASAMGSRLLLTVDFVQASKDSWGYSRRNDVVYLSNYSILTNKEEELFILSPEAMLEKYAAFGKQAVKLAVDGVRFEFVGRCVTFNYNSGHYHTSAQALETYRQMLTEAADRIGFVSVEGGNIATAQHADMLTDVPYEDSGFQFTTTAVPFYQIVMHGVRDYTATPGNLSSDLDREVLRWVEMGYMPYFELTWGSTEDLMYTDYQHLFTAQYTAWIDEVAEIAAAFTTGDMAQVRNALMMRHECVADGVYRVTYDNGCIVCVNYNDAEVLVDGLTVPAMDYIVVKGGAQ
ncbi:MAG: hypothetical protein IKK57_05735 [Clostridia bacterium]|nr:hypothetical protein [Clostridia bacterium]